MELPQIEDCSESTLERLVVRKSLDGLDNQAALGFIGRLIDCADDLQHIEATKHALRLCDVLAERQLKESESALLDYFQGNAWSTLRKIKGKDPRIAGAWEQPELAKELFHFRRAIRHAGFEKLDKIRRCQILTNTANLFNTVGRCTEAIEYWNRALAIMPNFGMALGNRGYGLMYYARALHDRGHAVAVMKFAHDDLHQATTLDAFFESPRYGEVKEAMAREAETIATHIDLEKVGTSLKFEGHSLGRSKSERSYRLWCLEHRLFLNPLNELGSYPIASIDVLTLPDLVVEMKEPPTLIGFYNQLKQEYGAARFLYYEGIQNKMAHFADRGVLLYDTLDYPAYSLAVERIKAAFRMTYSLFDKFAFFINAYWRLGMSEKSINFRSVWYSKMERGHPDPLRECFSGYENWPLRGLFWLSKDLLEEGTELADTVEPDAEAIKTIRNHLEHKYLKVHDWPWMSNGYTEATHDSLRDSLAYSITRGDLEAKALRLLKLARAGLTYISLAVHREEQLRAEGRGDGLVLPMPINSWPDEWKR